MNNIIKTTIYSVATCALLFSLQGCGQDRAGVTPEEAKTLDGKSLPGTRTLNCGKGTDDEDCDYLPDAQEGPGKAYPRALPNNRDTDNDGLSDGCEYAVAGALNDYAVCRRLKTFSALPYADDPDSDNDGIKDGDEATKLYSSGKYTDPMDDDSDNDGLLDGDEIGDIGSSKDKSTYITDPTNPDTDGDMLSDGVEVESAIKTNPKLFDSDEDGVSDGIEVCGTKGLDNTHTNGYGSGKITAIDYRDTGLNISISDGNDFYTDKLASLVNHYGGNTDCSTPSDTNNDSDGKIDALDPTNDSDGDDRPNIAEKTKNTDPLDFTNKYSWITETADGQKMIALGFKYIPKTDSKDGFWMADIEARQDGSDSKAQFVDSNKSTIEQKDESQARNIISTSNITANVGNTLFSPTVYLTVKDQYEQLFSFNGSWSNESLTVQNKFNDFYVAPSYTVTINELKNDKEVLNDGNDNDNYSYLATGTNSYGTANVNNTLSFRGATNRFEFK